MRRTMWPWIGGLVLLLVAGNVGIYLFVERTFQDRIDDQLRNVGQNVAASISVSPSTSSGGQIVNLPDLDPFASPGNYVQVVNAEGTGMAQPPELGGVYLTVPARALTADCSSDETFFNTEFRDMPMRVLSVPLRDPAGNQTGTCSMLGAIQVAAPLISMRHDLALLRDMLIAFGGAEALLGLAAFLWLRSRTEPAPGSGHIAAIQP
jgi:hypothetical protein